MRNYQLQLQPPLSGGLDSLLVGLLHLLGGGDGMKQQVLVHSPGKVILVSLLSCSDLSPQSWLT